MAKYQIALNLRDMNYGKLQVFARHIYKGFSSSSVFTSPVPPLAEQLADVDLLKKRNEKWGSKGNRGSTLDKALLVEIRDKVRENLRRSARYVLAAQPDNSLPATDVGFVLKKPYGKNSLMERVLNLRQIMHPTIQLNYIKTKWSRPANAPKSTIITYKVFRSADEDIHHTQQIAIVRKCNYTDMNLPKPGRYFYWVIPVNTQGDGVLSDLCMGVAFW